MIYEIYINKRLYKVNYLVYLCHMTNHFKRFESLDTYVDFYINFRFNNQEEVLKFVLSVYNEDARTKNKLNVLCIRYGSLFSNILKHGLLYAYILIKNYYFYLGISRINAVSLYPPSQNKIINTFINYDIDTYSDEYKKISPHLKLYKALSFYTSNIITEDMILSTLKMLNLNCENVAIIHNDLFNHGVILPYKNYYVWSNPQLKHQLINMDMQMVNNFCMNLLLSKLNFQNR